MIAKGRRTHRTFAPASVGVASPSANGGVPATVTATITRLRHEPCHADVSITKPKGLPPESLLWATPDGNLMGEDPRQTKLELREVTAEPARELKAAPAEPVRQLKTATA